MTNNLQNNAGAETPIKRISIKVFGVGGAGINLLELMLKDGLPGVGFVAVNTDPQSLAASSASDKVQLETQLLRGLGTGGDPDLGRALAEEQLPRLKSLCEGVDVIFILAGLGGGAQRTRRRYAGCAAGLWRSGAESRPSTPAGLPVHPHPLAGLAA